MPLHLRELHKGQRFVLIRTGDKFVYLGVGVSPYSGSCKFSETHFKNTTYPQENRRDLTEHRGGTGEAQVG